MELKSGDKLGPYEILAPLGKGGMGEVHRAHDPRLRRDVAIKVSAEQFSERFEREARAIAKLNHPNICQIYDVGSNYLVMEYVEGTPLKGPLPLDQVLKYAEQICDALDAAHRSGIVHRDLKPANILLTKKGIKLLDFGLAQVASGPNDVTVTQLTNVGAVMGTPAYMSPEQSEGSRLDARTDIYSLGCVIYEMLTGKRAGRDRTPVAAPFESVLRTCLEHDPDERWQSARELKHALTWAAHAQPEKISRKPRLLSPILLSASVMMIVIAAAGSFYYYFHSSPAEGTALRLQLDPPAGLHFIAEENLGGIALSPDGRIAAFVTGTAGKSQLWVQPLDGSIPRSLAGAENATYPFWSPDSKSIGFFSDGKLRRINADGGALMVLCDIPTPYGGGAWTTGDKIVLGTTGGVLSQVSASGGAISPFTATDEKRSETTNFWPQILPGGGVLYYARSDVAGAAGVYAVSPSRSSERVHLLDSTANAVYAEAAGTGWLLWLRGSSLVAQEFDPRTLKLTGEPRPLADPVSTVGPPANRLNIAIPGGGRLLYSSSRVMNQFTWLDRTGKPTGEAGQRGNYTDFRASPDGKRIAAETNIGDIWLIDSARPAGSPFTLGARNNIFPVWSPDGQTIVFHRGDHELMRKASGLGGEELLMRFPNIPDPTDWSRDGRLILFFEVTESAGRASRDLWVLPVTPEGRLAPGAKPIPWAQTPFNEKLGRFSPEPEPHWIAYQSDESGRYEIYVDAWPQPRGKIRLSTDGGQFPVWGPGGGELFFISPDGGVMSVALKKTASSLEPGEPHELFPLPTASIDPGSSAFDISPDGQRFLVRTPSGQASEALSMIVNWPALLKK